MVLLGSLPWQGLKAADATKKYKLILEKKQSLTPLMLCQGLPREFAQLLVCTVLSASEYVIPVYAQHEVI